VPGNHLRVGRLGSMALTTRHGSLPRPIADPSGGQRAAYPPARLDVIERPFEFIGDRPVTVRTHASFVRESPSSDARGPDIEVGSGTVFAALPNVGDAVGAHHNFLRGWPRLRLRGTPGATGHGLTSLFGVTRRAQPGPRRLLRSPLAIPTTHQRLAGEDRESGRRAPRRCHLLSRASSGGDLDGVLTSE